MLRISTDNFHQVCCYMSPTALFASKCVSKEWCRRVEKDSLWKRIVKIHHPGALLIAPNLEKFMRDVSRPMPEIDDFEFFMEISSDGKVREKHHWSGHDLPMPTWGNEQYN